MISKSQQVQYDPCCPSYKMLQAPVKTFGSVSIVVGDHLFLLGGYFTEPGNEVDVVFSSQILKKKRCGSHATLWARPARKLEKLQICLNWAIYGSKWIYVYLLCIFSQFPTFLGWLISIISPVINKVSFYTVCTQ